MTGAIVHPGLHKKLGTQRSRDRGIADHGSRIAESGIADRGLEIADRGFGDRGSRRDRAKTQTLRVSSWDYVA